MSRDEDALGPQCQRDRELHQMGIPVFKIVTGADAEFIWRERHPVPAQRLDVRIESRLVLAGMQAKVVQDPTGLPVAQG